MINLSSYTQFDPANGTIDGYPTVEKRLSQLPGIFADNAAYKEALKEGNDPLVYTVTSVVPAQGDGQLHYGIGRILPGRVGREYYMTHGHFHERRIAAEIYIGLKGTGLMLLEDEKGSMARSIDLTPDSIVYVPGHTAHRTINTGPEPLTYIGIYPADAGHDYGALATRNFSKVVAAQNGTPLVSGRQDFLNTLV